VVVADMGDNLVAADIGEMVEAGCGCSSSLDPGCHWTCLKGSEVEVVENRMATHGCLKSWKGD
jgi:hypothetical protein